jgi:hypothetical protein
VTLQEEQPEQEEGLRLRNNFSVEQQVVAGQEDPNMCVTSHLPVLQLSYRFS